MSKDLFRGAAWYYARYRPGYPDKFFKHVIKKFQLDGTGRLLDLGCGTGQLAITLAPYFEKVVAIDPDHAMLAEGRRAAKRKRVKNIKWTEGSSRNLRANLGKFRLVVAGRSFHYMNQAKTLRAVYRLLGPGGGFVIMSENSFWRSNSRWQKAVKAIIQKYLGQRRRAGSGYFSIPGKRFETFIRESPFRRFEEYRQTIRRTWDSKSIIGYLYSTSYSHKSMFGKQASAFEREIKKILSKLNSADKFTEINTLSALIVRR